MFEQLASKFDAPGLVFLTIILCVAAIVGVGIVAHYWFKGRELALKESMIARGMLAQDILDVLNAGAASLAAGAQPAAPTNEWNFKENIITQMLSEGRSAEEIQAVLQTAGVSVTPTT